MPTNTKTQNRHLVDQLADVRAMIKEFEREERALRDKILETGDTVGDENVAMVKESVRNLLDRPALEARFGETAVAECTKPSTVTTLSLFKKTVDVFA
jgi:hypothetical protein